MAGVLTLASVLASAAPAAAVVSSTFSTAAGCSATGAAVGAVFSWAVDMVEKGVDSGRMMVWIGKALDGSRRSNFMSFIDMFLLGFVVDALEGSFYRNKRKVCTENMYLQYRLLLVIYIDNKTNEICEITRRLFLIFNEHLNFGGSPILNSYVKSHVASSFLAAPAF